MKRVEEQKFLSKGAFVAVAAVAASFQGGPAVGPAAVLAVGLSYGLPEQTSAVAVASAAVAETGQGPVVAAVVGLEVVVVVMMMEVVVGLAAGMVYCRPVKKGPVAVVESHSDFHAWLGHALQLVVAVVEGYAGLPA